MSYREIENGDLPAYPTANEEKTDHYAEMPSSLIKSEGGLTKREIFAMHAMHGFISKPTSDNSALMTIPTIIEKALRCADELLKQLKSDKLSKESKNDY